MVFLSIKEARKEALYRDIKDYNPLFVSNNKIDGINHKPIDSFVRNLDGFIVGICDISQLEYDFFLLFCDYADGKNQDKYCQSLDKYLYDKVME